MSAAIHPDIQAIFRQAHLGVVDSGDTMLLGGNEANYNQVAEQMGPMSRDMLLEILFEAWNSPVSIGAAFGEILPHLPLVIVRRLTVAMLLRNMLSRASVGLLFAPVYREFIHGDDATTERTAKAKERKAASQESAP